MKHYVTLHEIITEFENWQKQSPVMNSFGFGNLIDFGNTIDGEEQNKPVQYPFMFVVPQSISYEENTTNYQLTIIFADLLNTDMMNQMDCVSDMSLQARRFLSAIKRGQQNNPDLYDMMDTTLPSGAIPFLERMADNVAGVALNLYVTVFEDINDCNYYETPTPCPDPNPNPTLNLTVNRTPSGSDTIYIESWEQGVTSITGGGYYPLPSDLTLNITLHATNGGNYTYDFTLPKYSTYNEFNITGLTQGNSITATTQNWLIGVPDCWDINYTNTWQVKRCSDGVILPNTYFIPETQDWTGYVFDPSGGTPCLEVLGKKINSFNIFTNFDPNQTWVDCADCLTP